MPTGAPAISQAAKIALSAALLFVVLFWRLGAPTFWDPDEAHYAETTREMIATGDWWAPYYNAQPFFDKPVLFHQLQGAVMLVFGQTELAARVVPAVAALALIAITVWFGSTVGSLEIGIVAGLLLAANPGVFALARYAILDTLFTMFLFGGAAALALAALHERPRWQWVGYVGIALAVIMKGPLALVLCGLTLALAIVVSADLRRRLLGLRWLVGLGLVVAASAPWFIYMYVRFRQDFVNGYFLDENVRLFSSNRFGNQPGFFFYFEILATGLLPWTGVLVGRLVDDARSVARGERLGGAEVLLWAWTTAIVGFFSLSTFKLDHYVFPAAPSICLLCAWAWSDVRAQPFASAHVWSRLGLLLVGPILICLGLGSAYFLRTRLALPSATMLAPVAIMLAGAGLTLVAGLRRNAPWIVSAAVVVTYAVVVAVVMPALERQKVTAEVARFVASRVRATDRVASYRLNRWNPSFRFYVNHDTTFLDEPAEAVAFFSQPPPFYGVMLREGYDDLVARGAPLRIVAERDGLWVTTGRALWREFTPTARFVVVTKAQ
ncbi:MAG: glycosyltransferase family 39 protein [Acidobacteria bacterium]|nr:glycosyltransferase family 39 protein [Acidobacteriota bacterium]